MEAVDRLIEHLRPRNYRFVTVTPLTHERVLKRRAGLSAQSLRDVFGWSLPFQADLLPIELLQTLEREKLVVREVPADLSVGAEAKLYRSKIRVSTIDDQYFVHSAYPTTEADSVFFGPDTYRFVRFIKERLATKPLESGARVLDIGCGSGAGGWMVSKFFSKVELVLNDINETALKFAESNVRANGGVAGVTYALGDSAVAVDGEFDLIIANPPFLVDPEARTYRHGGEKLGRGLALRMMRQSLPRLKTGGRILLYTGVAINDGVDGFRQDLRALIDTWKFDWGYEEIDPDIFGEELEQPAYTETDRIAAVGVEIRRRS